MSVAARQLADAIRGAARSHTDRLGPGRWRATVTRWDGEDDFECDLHGTDLELDQDDITLGRSVRREIAEDGIDVGDALVLVALGEGDYVAIDIESEGETAAGNGAHVAVLKEASPSVEYPEFAALASGADWTAAFEAARDYVGPGGAFRAENRLYDVGDLVLLPQQRLEGQGPARTILRAAEGAVRVIDMPGMIRHSRLKGVKIDGRGRASAGTRLQALNGTGGETSQNAAFEDVEWWQCSVGQLVAGTGAVPQDGQADKCRYLGCSIYQCSIGLWVTAINAQQQLWEGGDISDPIDGAMIGVLLHGGGFTGISMQFQSTILGTGTMIKFAGANVHQVLLQDIISEGWLTGIDSGDDNLWPLQGVTVINSSLQVHEPAGGDLMIIDRGGSVAGLIGMHSAMNGGPIRLRGNDTFFEDLWCSYNLAGGVGGRVIEEGINSRHLPRRGVYIQVVAASTITANPGATTISVLPDAGGAAINRIAGGWDGREVTLSFAGAVTVNSGAGGAGSIALEGGAAFLATAADSLTLFSEGGVWRQKGRSVN